MIPCDLFSNMPNEKNRDLLKQGYQKLFEFIENKEMIILWNKEIYINHLTALNYQTHDFICHSIWKGMYI